MVYLPAPRRAVQRHFEVDSTESVWYTGHVRLQPRQPILKLTPQSQYGISIDDRVGALLQF